MQTFPVKLPQDLVQSLKSLARKLSHASNQDVTWCDLLREGAKARLAQDTAENEDGLEELIEAHINNPENKNEVDPDQFRSVARSIASYFVR